MTHRCHSSSMLNENLARVLFAAALLASVFCAFSRAEDEADLYSARVKPILSKRCYSCHASLKQEGDLRLDTAELIRHGGSTGPAVVASNSSESVLVRRLRATEDSERMPLEGAPLSPEDIAAIERWIDAGAAGPLEEKAEVSTKDHWAFRPPVRAPVPPFFLGSNWVDSFIDERLAKEQLAPLGQASRRHFIRRVTLDLLGLPPTSNEIQDFESDPAPDATERLVDRLLADPRYGERWGRHWMDVWRYSDWYGRRSVPDVMNSYPHIWRWRDWIVRQLNNDRGYDQMVQAMLAADEISPGNDDEVVATGFLVRNWFKWNYENWMKDNVEHTSKAFLGLTLNCSHCHDHKYDPLSQEEYFRFRAFFEPLELRQDRVAGLPDPGPFQKYVYAQAYGPIAAGRIRVFDEKLDAKTFMYSKGDARLRMEGRAPVEPGVPAILGTADFVLAPVELPPEAYYPGLKESIREEERVRLQTELAQARQSLADLKSSAATGTIDPWTRTWAAHELAMAELRVRVAECDEAALVGRVAADDARYLGRGDPATLASAAHALEKHADYARTALRAEKAEGALLRAHQQLSMPSQETPAAAVAQKGADDAQKELVAARMAFDAARTELTRSGDTYTPLSPIYPMISTGRRRALARWITSPANPLSSRVAVNHLWHRHFGRGIVDTPNNFGRSGHPPTHPQLLDALSVELVDHQWQMKHIHRLLVTSSTYRRASHIPADRQDLRAKDPENRWWARASQKRMEAEVVRDSLLASAGLLDSTVGGQEIDASLGEQSRRRSIYFSTHGEGKMLFLETFDAPDVCDAYERTTSVRPQQALALSNSVLSKMCSEALAESFVNEAGTIVEEEDFVDQAFESVLGRVPFSSEREAALRFLRLPAVSSERAPACASLIHSLFNHHDFVTIR